jgi:UDP-glucose 4-epimerase
MNVLITGVAGLLGSRLADWIVEKKNIQVIGIDDLSGGYEENINSNVIFYKRNIAEHDISDIFKRHKPDLVYHMAAYAAEGLSPFIRMFNYKNNLLATANIVNNCITFNTKRLVFTSTMAVYGYGDNSPPFDESLVTSPIDPYGIAKAGCEADIQVAGVQHGLDWCIIRPHNVYGIKQNLWDKYRNVLGIWMYQKINNIPMTIFGDGEQKRAFSYIDDCLEPLWKAGVSERASKQIINLGGIKEYTINEACEILREVVGGSDYINLEKRHEVKYAYPTYQKSIDILDYKDKTPLKEGLEKMWAWAQNQPNRERFEWSNYEIEKGIYSYWKK